MKRLALLGASGHAKVVADAALAAGWPGIEFFDDGWPAHSSIGAREIVGDTSSLLQRIRDFEGIVVAIGDCDVRWQKHQVLLAAGASLPVIIHPAAWVSPSAQIGAGSVVMAGCVVQADVVTGGSCILNTNSSIDHDCRLGDAVHIAPGAHLSGNVTVGDRSLIGIGASVRPGVTIGREVVVGAGAVVVKECGDHLTLVGCPARPIVLRAPKHDAEP